MNEITERYNLYLQYDGAIPRHQTHTGCRVGHGLMLRQVLRNVRMRRHLARTKAEFAGLAELCRFAAQIRLDMVCGAQNHSESG
jgi:hypothetical protein